MTPTTSIRRFRIVAALDPSEYAPIVLEHAVDQAARHDAVDLHFVTIVDTGSALADAKSRLGALALEGLEYLRGATTDWRSRLHVRAGKPAEEIATLANDLAADLLVIGRFGLHPSRQHDSTVDRVLELVTCPTLVIGLAGRVVEPRQCAACVAVREESDGERWFCADHTSPDGIDLALRLPSSTRSVQGGPLL